MVSLELFPIGSSFLLTKFIPFISLNKLHYNLVFDLPYVSEGELKRDLPIGTSSSSHFQTRDLGKENLEKVYHHSSKNLKHGMIPLKAKLLLIFLLLLVPFQSQPVGWKKG